MKTYIYKTAALGLVVFALFPMFIHYRGEFRGEYFVEPQTINEQYCSISLDYQNCTGGTILSTPSDGVHLTNVLYAVTADRDTKAYFAGDIPNKEFSYTPVAAMWLPAAASLLAMFVFYKKQNKTKQTKK